MLALARVLPLVILAAVAISLAGIWDNDASADQTVTVALIDNPFAILADPTIVNAGPVKFDVTNVGAPFSYLPHDMVVIATDLPPDGLPVDGNGFVDEPQLNVVARTASLNPGESESLQVDLPGGIYVLICNIAANHYTAGMYTAFQVMAPTPTPTTTPKPTPTPKDPGGDTDGDTLPNDIDPDDDNDSCTDVQELGDDAALGGRRNPHNFWDFYDVPTGIGLARDGSVASEDIFGVIGRFNATDVGPGDFDRFDDPLSTPNPVDNSGTTEAYRQNYHPAYDRGELVGKYAWNLGPADGAIASLDIFGVLGQFGHSC